MTNRGARYQLHWVPHFLTGVYRRWPMSNDNRSLR